MIVPLVSAVNRALLNVETETEGIATVEVRHEHLASVPRERVVIVVRTDLEDTEVVCTVAHR